MFFSIFAVSLAIGALFFASACGHTSSAAFDEEAQRLIDQLKDRDFDRRQAAEAKLREMGLEALPDLEQAASPMENLAVTSACLRLIVEMYESEEDAVHQAGKAALTRLSKSETKLVSRRANAALLTTSNALVRWIEDQMEGAVVRSTTLSGNPVVEVHLSRLPAIDPRFPPTKFRNEDIQRLYPLEQLQLLRLDLQSQIDDGLFEYVGRLRNLRRLTISGTSITGGGFADLPTTSKIESLDISYCYKLEASSLKNLNRLPALREVILRGQGIEGWSNDLWRREIHLAGSSAASRQSAIRRTAGLRGGIGNQGVAHLCASKSLESVSLAGTKITDQAMRFVDQLPKLKSLNLDRTGVTDAAVALLEGSSIEELSLAYTFISDECIASLAKLNQLRKLNLDSTAISGQGLELLKDLPHLTEVNLAGTRINDLNLKALGQLPRLSRLNLKNTFVTFSGLLDLSRDHPNFSLPQLAEIAGFSSSDSVDDTRQLTLKRQTLTDSAVEAISQFRNLQILDLSRSSVDDRHLDHLQSLVNLRSLDLSFTKVTDQGLQRLASLRNLEKLQTQGTEITFTAMRQLICDQFGRNPSQLIGLGQYQDRLIRRPTSVDLIHRGVSDDDLATLGELTDVYSLKLAGNAITDKGIGHLPTDSKMEILWISGPGITVESLRHLSQLKHLTTLWITDAAVDDTSLRVLADFGSLKCLNLCGNPMGDEAIEELATLTSLKTLMIDHNAFANEQIDRLKSLQPHLEIVRSNQVTIRKINQQATLYKVPVEHPDSRPRGGMNLNHPLRKLFGPEYFREYRSLNLPDRFDCTDLIGMDSLQSISFGENIVKPGALEAIRRLPKLSKISLYRSFVEDEQLRHLAGMTQLEQLDLQRSTVTNEGLKHLTGLTQLKALSLGGNSSKLEPGFLDCLDEFPQLQQLWLFRTPLDDDALQGIARFKSLNSLNLREAPICEGLKFVTQLPNLQRLELGNTFITDRELNELGKLDLKLISLDGTFVSAEGLEAFRKENPQAQLIGANPLSDDMLKVVEPLRAKRIRMGRNANQNISYLNLRNIEWSPEIINTVEQLPELEDLRITGAPNDELIRVLAEKPSLQHLAIWCGSIEKTQLEKLSKLTSFRGLSFYDSGISLEVLEFIGTMTQLQRLSLYKSKVDGQILNDQQFKQLKNLQGLTWLNLGDTEISDRSLETIASFSNMQRLLLNRTRVTDQGVYPVERWPQLQEITAVGTEVTRNEQPYGRRRVETRAAR